MENLVLSTSSACSSLTTPSFGEGAVLFQAICVDAIRVIFALRFISASGVTELALQLRSCRLRSDGASEGSGIPRASAVKLDGGEALGAPLSFRAHPHLRQSQHEDSRTWIATPVSPLSEVHVQKAILFEATGDARRCIENASLYSHLTAAHLLRCSTWTSTSLVSFAPYVQDGAIPAELHRLHASRLLQLASRAEELRTREAAWCATALVPFIEWLMRQSHTSLSSSTAPTLTSFALDLTECERIAPQSSFLSENGNAQDALARYRPHPWRFGASPRVVSIDDSLPLFFPSLAFTDASIPAVAPLGKTSQPVSTASVDSRICSHRWFLEDFPRWCVQVSLQARALKWHDTSAQRRVLERWRARRGMRVVELLSHATDCGANSQPPPPSDRTDATSLGKMSPCRLTSAAAEKETIDTTGVAVLSLVPLPTATAATAAEANTGDVETSSKLMRAQPKQHCEPSGDEIAGSRVSLLSAITSVYTTLSLIESRIDSNTTNRSAGLAADPVGTSLEIPHDERQRTSVTSLALSVSRLDSVLRGQHELSMKQTGHSGQKQVEGGPLQPSTPPYKPLQAVASVQNAGQWENAISLVTACDNSNVEDPVQRLVARCNGDLLRKVFHFWRNVRLYESMATRFLWTLHRESVRKRCWSQWRLRYAALLRKEKGKRDAAMCEDLMKVNAVAYFRRLLRVWRAASLARHFLLSTIASRAFHWWVGRTRLARVLRTTGQPFAGARRVKRQVWFRWRERYLERVADRHHAICKGRSMLHLISSLQKKHGQDRTASEHRRRVLMQGSWQRWTSMLSLMSRLHLLATSSPQQLSLLRQGWMRWCMRWQRRKRCKLETDIARAFRFAHEAGRCFDRWNSRRQREDRIRQWLSQLHRRTTLRPLFLRWHRRAEVGVIVRRGQEELAWKIHEQLLSRRMLRTWLRRARQLAMRRQQQWEDQYIEEADRTDRLNRLARSFFRWRTRSLLCRRYGVDRRLIIAAVPAAERPTIAMGSSKMEERHFAAGRDTSSRSHVGKVEEDAGAAESLSVAHGTLPSLSSTVTVDGALLIHENTGTCRESSPSLSMTPPRKPHRFSKQGPISRSQAVTRKDVRIQSCVRTTKESARSPSTRKGSMPTHNMMVAVSNQNLQKASLLHKIDLARRLLASQQQKNLAFFRFGHPLTTGSSSPPSFGTGVERHRSGRTGNSPTPPSRSKHALSYSASVPLPRARSGGHRVDEPLTMLELPPGGSAHSFGSNKSNPSSVYEDVAPRRSRTATPLFRPVLRETSNSSPYHASTPRHSGALVNSPRPSPRRLCQRAFTSAAPEKTPEISYESPSSRPNHLLGQMELLLDRVRTIEKKYRSPAASIAASEVGTAHEFRKRRKSKHAW